MPELGQLSWVENEGPMALALAFAEGLAEAELDRHLQGIQGPVFEASWAEAEALQDHAGGNVVVQTDSAGSWAVLVEPNGFVSTDTAILEPLSSNGSALSVFWNVNALMLVTAAEHGRIIRRFDPLLMTGSGDPLPAERDLPWGHPGQPRTAMLALVERITGITVTPEWLFGTRRRTLRVTKTP